MKHSKARTLEHLDAMMGKAVAREREKLERTIARIWRWANDIGPGGKNVSF